MFFETPQYLTTFCPSADTFPWVTQGGHTLKLTVLIRVTSSSRTASLLRMGPTFPTPYSHLHSRENETVYLLSTQLLHRPWTKALILMCDRS